MNGTQSGITEMGGNRLRETFLCINKCISLLLGLTLLIMNFPIKLAIILEGMREEMTSEYATN